MPRPFKPNSRSFRSPKGGPVRNPEGLNIVFEDEHVIVVDKPAGMLTADASKTGLDDLFGLIKSHVREAARRRGTQVWIIHRLDREASGLLVFAKTEAAFISLKDQFRAKTAGRIYTAVCRGEWSNPDRSAVVGSVRSMLTEDARGFVTATPQGAGGKRHQREDSESLEGKLAITHYRVLASGKGRSLVQVRLETGRKHQIRVHMAALGHGLVGDHHYGQDPSAIPEHANQRLCLHGTELVFTHPATGKLARFHSPAPDHFYELAGTRAGNVAGQAQLAIEPSSAPADADRGGDTSWDHVSEWYDELLTERVSDHHEQVVLPGTMRLLGAMKDARILDVACGQGILCRRMAEQGARVVGIDLAEGLIGAARKLGGEIEYHIADARALEELHLSGFDAASCVLALMNIEPLAPALAGIHQALKPGGCFVSVMLHPAFRNPGQTSWGFGQESAQPATRTRTPATPQPVQFRRVDGYLTPAARDIVMNPGAVSSGARPITTVTYHRPIQFYINELARAGFMVDALEEWTSSRTSQPGPRAAAENKARKEIPMFLAIRAVKPPAA